MQAVGISHRGKVRSNNEDRYLIDDDEAIAIYAVADGMGGHAAGEVASSMALEVVHNFSADRRQEFLMAADNRQTVRPLLEEMLAQANAEVLNAGTTNPDYAGMGTTLTMLMVIAGQSWLAHIGDSRAYLLREDDLLPLTDDHTLVSQLVRTGQISAEEQDGHPQRNILTRALGTDEVAVFDLLPLTLLQNDGLLLCSDGLYGLVSNAEIKHIMTQDNAPLEKIQELVALANEKGGTDNITAVLIYNI